MTAAGVTIGGDSSTGFTIGAGCRAGIYANISGGNRITVQGNIFTSYTANESRGMVFENLWNGSLITGNSFADPRVGTGIIVVNADGATISNNMVPATAVKYAFLTFKAEAFQEPGSGNEYCATNPSLINNVVVTGNTINMTDYANLLMKNGHILRYGICFPTSIKNDNGIYPPKAQDLTVGSGGVRITNNVFTLSDLGIGVYIDENDTATDTTVAHITGVENILINSNSFHSSGNYGVYNGQETTVNALYNWWGDVAGPSVSSNPYYTNTSGDVVMGNVDYIPWLIHKTLNSGWNIFSTPIVSGASTDTINEALDYWTSDSGKVTAAYYYNANSQIWVPATSLTPMVPVYLNMTGTATIDVLMSTSFSTPPSMTLYQGWNLVGPAQLYERPADATLNSAYYGSGGSGTNLGYSQVLSLSMNFYSGNWICDRTNANSKHMYPTEGYWVYMANQGILGGFTYTPITEE